MIDEGELSYLIRHERALVRQPLVEVLLEKRSGEGPAPEREAAERLLCLHAPWALDLERPIKELLRAAGDRRDQRLFLAFLLRPEGVSQAQLASDQAVPVAQARQIVRRATHRMRAARERAPGPLAWAAGTLRGRLGPVTTAELAATWTAHLGAGTTPAAELLAWLAGPYLPMAGRPGWLALEPVWTVGRTVQSLAADGGVRRITDVEAELHDVGILPDQFQEWLVANGAALVHGLAVLVSGPLAEAVERLLDAHARPRTLDSLSVELAAVGRVVAPADLERATRGPRFARARSGAVRLSAWGGSGRETVEQGGRQPAQAPQKTTSEAGRRAVGDGPGTAERVWLVVPVDEDALRGAEASAPAALGEGLKLAPNLRRSYASRWGPVALAHEGSHLVRGSVRAVALAAGAQVGDTLMLGFSPAGDLLVEVRQDSAQTARGNLAGTAPTLFPEMLTGGTP